MQKKRLWLNKILSIDEKWFVRMAQIRHILEVMVLTFLMLHGVARLLVMSSTDLMSDNSIMYLTSVLFAVYIVWLRNGITMFLVFVAVILLSKWAKKKIPFQITIRSFTFIVLKLPVALFALIGSPKWFFISFLVLGGVRLLLFAWQFWCEKQDGAMNLFYSQDDSESTSNQDSHEVEGLRLYRSAEEPEK